MRRIAAVTVTTVALSVGMALAAAPAGAAPADTAKKVTKSWVTNKGKTAIFKSIKADGTYTRTGKSIKTRGYVQDYARNGWSPGVQFRVWNKGEWRYSAVYFAKLSTTGKPADQKFRYNYGAFWSATGTKLQVREVALKATNSKSRKYGAWKKLF
ncbi:hypothetical protein LO762_19265 [Actinocorallia sp. API 0066]|uniref:hypothetical protein n=1 Tax=Actinocorallia sp. API 0066 TaxID=2896846 RepID=UPI001E3038AC|nr:hypothetical protein [Actinocorallia sp. API 0066]MCD0451321.1 hypothetical protein [Actinocorallia sp. API 0066]